MERRRAGELERLRAGELESWRGVPCVPGVVQGPCPYREEGGGKLWWEGWSGVVGERHSEVK